MGLPIPGRPGSNNAITDVSGVFVGYKTLSFPVKPLVSADDALPVQTGVTAILPRGHQNIPRPVWAGQFTLNGNGEMTGTHWVQDGGYFVGPVMLTNTHSVGPVHHGAVSWMISHYAETWLNNHLWAMPIVAETYDGVLSDINGLHVTSEHAREAIRSAHGGRLEEGNVGGGTGMICYEFKGGTGTSSRIVEIDGNTFTLGILVQANHGIRPWLRVLGVPVGARMMENRIADISHERGSIICIIGTDIPLLPGQLERLARRGAIGIGRTGTPGGNNSGDIFLAFSTANEMDLPQLSGCWRTMKSLNDEFLDPIYMATVEAIEEAILNAMFAAQDVQTARPRGHICRAIDVEAVVKLVKEAGAF
jgi:D-aminopeptidase